MSNRAILVKLCQKGNLAKIRNLLRSNAVVLKIALGICKLVGEALWKRVRIVYYGPKALGLKKGERFPFKYIGLSICLFLWCFYGTVHFFASSSKVKLGLGWKPLHMFQSDVTELCEAYVANGRDKKEIDFSTDDKILAAVA